MGPPFTERGQVYRSSLWKLNNGSNISVCVCANEFIKNNIHNKIEYNISGKNGLPCQFGVSLHTLLNFGFQQQEYS